MSEDWWHLNTSVVLLQRMGYSCEKNHGPELTRHLLTGGCICGFLAEHMAQDRYEYWEIFSTV